MEKEEGRGKREKERRGTEEGGWEGGTKGKFRVTDERGVHVSRKTSSLLVIYCTSLE
jgi:hypothetical protein